MNTVELAGLNTIERKIRTLIVVNMTLTESKAALTGAIFEVSFARFRLPIAAFNEEPALFLPFCRWETVAIFQNVVAVAGRWGIAGPFCQAAIGLGEERPRPIE